jgi:Ca2+-binding EF-hand superfamily protein
MKTRLMLLCAAVLLSSAALADDNKMDEKGSGDTFKALDTDGDGKVSKSEAAANEHFANSFDKLDGNSDGYVTKREWQRNTMRRPKPGP